MIFFYLNFRSTDTFFYNIGLRNFLETTRAEVELKKLEPFKTTRLQSTPGVEYIRAEPNAFLTPHLHHYLLDPPDTFAGSTDLWEAISSTTNIKYNMDTCNMHVHIFIRSAAD